jgi:N-acetylmuramic acid 6-phosphate etherase
VADLTICPVVGPEVVTGSTRLKAGTATKMVLNMLTTGAMVRIGKTYGNLMVDLRATNKKLIDRSIRILIAFTDLPRDEAETVLEACHGELKTAIVSVKRNVSPERAEELLKQAGGHLRRVLDAAE